MSAKETYKYVSLSKRIKMKKKVMLGNVLFNLDKKWQNIYLAAKTNCQMKSNSTIYPHVFSKENIITLVHLFTRTFIFQFFKKYRKRPSTDHKNSSNYQFQRYLPCLGVLRRTSQDSNNLDDIFNQGIFS